MTPPKVSDDESDKRPTKRKNGRRNPVDIDNQYDVTDDEEESDLEVTSPPSKKTRREETAIKKGSQQSSGYEADRGSLGEEPQRGTAGAVSNPDCFDATPPSESAEQLDSPTPRREVTQGSEASSLNPATISEQAASIRRGGGWDAINIPPFQEYIAPQRRRSTINDPRTQAANIVEAPPRRVSAVNAPTSHGGHEQAASTRRGSVWTAINVPRDQPARHEAVPPRRDSGRNATILPGSHGTAGEEEEASLSKTDPQQKLATQDELQDLDREASSANKEDSRRQEGNPGRENAVDIDNIWDVTPPPESNTTAENVPKGKRKAQDKGSSDNAEDGTPSKKARKEKPAPKRKAGDAGDGPRPMKKSRRDAASPEAGDDGSGSGPSSDESDKGSSKTASKPVSKQKPVNAGNASHHARNLPKSSTPHVALSPGDNESDGISSSKNDDPQFREHKAPRLTSKGKAGDAEKSSHAASNIRRGSAPEPEGGGKNNSLSDDNTDSSDKQPVLTKPAPKRKAHDAGDSSRPTKKSCKRPKAEDSGNSVPRQRRKAFGNYEWGTPKKTAEEEFAETERMAAQPSQRPSTAVDAQHQGMSTRSTRAKARATTQEPKSLASQAKQATTNKETFPKEEKDESKWVTKSKKDVTSAHSRACSRARSQAPNVRVTRSQSRGLAQAEEDEQIAQQQLAALEEEEEEPGEENRPRLSVRQQAHGPGLESIEAPHANLAEHRGEYFPESNTLSEPPGVITGDTRDSRVATLPWEEPPFAQEENDELEATEEVGTHGPKKLHDGAQHGSSNLEKPPRKVKPPNVHGDILTKRATQVHTIFVCGDNRMGQLGLGDLVTEESKPVVNKELKKVVDFDCGATHCIALTRGGEVLTWGLGTEENGALGTEYVNEEGTMSKAMVRESTMEENMIPREVDLKHLDPVNVTQVIATNDASFALTEDGRVLGWGTFKRQDENYQPYIAGLRRNDQVEKRPIQLKDWKGIIRLAGGGQHILGLDCNNVMYSMGSNLYGQLGLMTSRDASADQHTDEQGSLRRRKCSALKGGSKPAKIACGENTSFAIDKKGMLYAWGEDTRGQLGRGTMGLPQRRPEMRTVWYSEGKKVEKLQNVVAVDSGVAHTLACTKEGKVYSWGQLDHGAPGLGEEEMNNGNANFEGGDMPQVVKRPTEISGCKDIENVGAGSYHSIVMPNNGLAHTFGHSGNYQTGQGYDSEDDSPYWPHEPQELWRGGIEKMKVTHAAGGEKFTIFGCVPKTKTGPKSQPKKKPQSQPKPKKRLQRKR